jgi:hypothetical protein
MVVDVSLGNVCVKVLALDESQEKFIDDLNVRPRNFEHWFILFRVENVALWRHGRRDGSEEVFGAGLTA